MSSIISVALHFGPSKEFFRKAKGGEVDVMLPKTKFPKSFATQHFPENVLIQRTIRTYASFLTNFAIPACQGPLPTSWAPFLNFFGGTPPPPPPPHTHTHPGITALISSEKLEHISLPRKGLHTRLHYSGSILYDNAERDRQRLGASLHAPGLRS